MIISPATLIRLNICLGRSLEWVFCLRNVQLIQDIILKNKKHQYIIVPSTTALLQVPWKEDVVALRWKKLAQSSKDWSQLEPL